MTKLNLHVIGPYPCVYDETQTAQTVIVSPFKMAAGSIAPELNETRLEQHHQAARDLAEKGFVASQIFGSCANACPSCTRCHPLRIATSLFSPSRSQSKILRQNADLSFAPASLIGTGEHYALFHDYYSRRHPDNSKAKLTYPEFRIAMRAYNSMFEVRKGEKLLAFNLGTAKGDSLISAQTIYDLEESRERNLGTFIDMRMITHAARNDIAHMYLGTWAEGGRHIGHKTQYRGAEIMNGTKWVSYSKGADLAPADYSPVLDELIPKSS